ncbi:hypothetical protein [Vibrio porteresiae]|uniref:Hydroxylamine reductase n=1 Tax=Vibrio porteresiae DSM 19223 TaxID=1123496 RepID=A0ABZ0QI71_9VIBR|nr:hypothetical protein [Vibrio porteresiae]WPC76183.1 hypothetical protein R8Z52_16775 [Vibrio porteresiae DSM 19223]
MSRFIVAALAVATGLFALIFSVLVAIPLTIIALITGKKLNQQIRRNSFNQPHNERAERQDHVIEGEFEEVTRK